MIRNGHNPSYDLFEKLQSIDYHMVNKGFWFIGGQLPSRIRSKSIRTPDFSHSVDFARRTLETQGGLPSEASDYYGMPVLLCC